MEELLLINPAPRRRRRKAAAKRPAYRRAAAPARRAAPVRRRRRRHAVATYAANPAPRRHRRRVHRIATHAGGRRRRTYRRNPSGRTGIMSMLTGALTAGAGALAVDVITNFVPLPASMKTGNMGYVAKAGIAVLLGTLGGKVIGNRMASKMAEGALAVIAHDALKATIGPMVPGLGLSGLGYYPGGAIALPPSQYAAPAQLSEYVNSPGMAGMGDMSGFGEYVHAGF